MLSLRQLEILRAVMRLRTTVGAAVEVGLSQPAVSNAIRSMEATLGFALFDRVANRLIPTEEAVSLQQDAEPLFLMLQGIRQRAGDLRAGRRGRLRLAVTAELSDTFLPHALRRFLAGHAGVAVGVEVQPMAEMLDGIEAGMTHLGLVMEPDARPGIALHKLADMTMVCLCPAAAPLARLACVRPADLAGTRLIAPPEGSRIHGLVGEAFRVEGAVFAPAIEIRFMNAGMRLVEHGLGAMIADPLTAAAGRGLAVRPFQPAVPIRLYAAAREKPALRLATAFLADAALAVPDALAAGAQRREQQEGQQRGQHSSDPYPAIANA